MQAKDLRTGTEIVVRGEIYVVMEAHHHSPGNKRAFVQATIQSLRTGKTVQNRFSSGEDVEIAHLDARNCQYLYRDRDGYHFMDLEDFHTFPLAENVLGDQKYYLKENEEVSLDFFEGHPVQLVLPNHVYLKVVEAPPWLKGDSVSSHLKPVVTETGLKVQVPLFIKEGEVIKVDTRTGEYLGRQ